MGCKDSGKLGIFRSVLIKINRKEVSKEEDNKKIGLVSYISDSKDTKIQIPNNFNTSIKRSKGYYENYNKED